MFPSSIFQFLIFSNLVLHFPVLLFQHNLIITFRRLPTVYTFTADIDYITEILFDYKHCIILLVYEYH